MAFTGEVPNDAKITTRPLRQEVAYLPAPAHLNTEYIVIDLDCGFYMRPDVTGKILVGGVEPKCDPLHWVGTQSSYVIPPSKIWVPNHVLFPVQVDNPEDIDQSLGEDWKRYLHNLIMAASALFLSFYFSLFLSFFRCFFFLLSFYCSLLHAPPTPPYPSSVSETKR